MLTNDFYFRTNEWNETKHGMNIPYEVLTKSCYFVADPLSKNAASGGLNLTQVPMGNAYKCLLLENH